MRRVENPMNMVDKSRKRLDMTNRSAGKRSTPSRKSEGGRWMLLVLILVASEYLPNNHTRWQRESRPILWMPTVSRYA